MKLSEVQRAMLARLKANPNGERTPFTGGRSAGRDAAAWYRTAGSLARLGLITLEREGDARRAKLADSETGTGWCGSCVLGVVFESGCNIQRCDDCAIFPDDDAAGAFVLARFKSHETELLRDALRGVLHHNDAVKPQFQLPDSLIRHITAALGGVR